MIEKLKNEIKKLLEQQKILLKYYDYEQLKTLNEKIYQLREQLKHEKKLLADIEYEKKFDEKICEKIREV